MRKIFSHASRSRITHRISDTPNVEYLTDAFDGGWLPAPP